MSRVQKMIISGIISLVITSIGIYFFSFYKYGYSMEQCNYKRYWWLFNDSAKCDIDTFLCGGFVKERSILYYYVYKKNYNIRLWEFKDLVNEELKNIPINQKIDLSNVKFGLAEKFKEDITTKLGFSFKNSFHINLDENSNIIKLINSKHYKGFFGNISKMSFSNEANEHLVLFDYGYPAVKSFFLMYKTNKSFYVIIIQSDKPIDEKIINILNLK